MNQQRKPLNQYELRIILLPISPVIESSITYSGKGCVVTSPQSAKLAGLISSRARSRLFTRLLFSFPYENKDEMKYTGAVRIE